MTHAQTVLRTATKIFWALMAAALIFTLGMNGAEATHQPADKVAAAGGSTDKPAFVSPTANVVLLSETFRTSTTSDLLLQVSSECSIITDVTTVGNDNEAATGRLKYYLTISTNGGPERPVGVTSNSTSTTTSEHTDDGKVVFCDRTYRRETTMFDDTNATIRTFMETRAANAFNWIHLNAGSGIHTLKLYADYEEAETDTGRAQGVVGRRTMIIEPVKMKNDEHVQDVTVD